MALWRTRAGIWSAGTERPLLWHECDTLPARDFEFARFAGPPAAVGALQTAIFRGSD
jgi:hypothetical protein